MAKAFFAVPEGLDREIAGVRCRVFRPEGRASGVYLHFHGGGMMTGAPEMNDLPNRDLCRQHGLAVVSVDYRLAPEHPYPAGPDDGVAVAAWLVEHAEREFGSGRLIVGGESAGGYMAAAVSAARARRAARDRALRRREPGPSASMTGADRRASAASPAPGPDVIDPGASSSSPSATCPDAPTISAAIPRSRPRSRTCAACHRR
jgi:acetyl esterase/lipase